MSCINNWLIFIAKTILELRTYGKFLNTENSPVTIIYNSLTNESLLPNAHSRNLRYIHFKNPLGTGLLSTRILEY